MKCPYVTPDMECYFDEKKCIPPCPVLIVTNRKRCSEKITAAIRKEREEEQ